MKSLHNQPPPGRGRMPITRLLLASRQVPPGVHTFHPQQPVPVRGEAFFPAVLCFAIVAGALRGLAGGQVGGMTWLWIAPAALALVQIWILVGGGLGILTGGRVGGGVAFAAGMAVAAWMSWRTPGWPHWSALGAVLFAMANGLAACWQKVRNPRSKDA